LDSSQIDLPGSEVETIDQSEGTVKVRFSRAYILKSMTGSKERTRWWQAGDLVIEGVEDATPLPRGPMVCAGGDIDENVYTYRDMIPLPLQSRGHVRCDLRVQGSDTHIRVSGAAVELRMEGVPKYIEHVRPG
jgi:hypothetical protein